MPRALRDPQHRTDRADATGANGLAAVGRLARAMRIKVMKKIISARARRAFCAMFGESGGEARRLLFRYRELACFRLPVQCRYPWRRLEGYFGEAQSLR